MKHPDHPRIAPHGRRHRRLRRHRTGHRSLAGRPRRPASRCWLGAEVGLAAAARRRREGRRGRALTVVVDVADHDAVEAAADRVEAEPRTDRRLGQCRVHVGLRAVRGHRARGVPAGHGGDLPRLRQRHAGRAASDAPARSRGHRPGRLRAGPPRHPAAVGVLRRQARSGRLPRVAANRADARGQRGPGSPSSRCRPCNTPQFSLGALPAARGRRNRSRRSTSPRSRLVASSRPSTIPNAARGGSAPSTAGTIIANRVAGGLLDRYLARTGSPPSRPSSRGPRPAGQPVGARRRSRRARLRRARHLRRPRPRTGVGRMTSRSISGPDRDARDQPRERVGGRCDTARPVDLARLGLGILALARPQWLLRGTASRDGRWPRRVTRILGARYVVQSVAGSDRPRPVGAELDGAVDLVHAVTMVGFAAVFPDHRRLALTSGALALAFAVARPRPRTVRAPHARGFRRDEDALAGPDRLVAAEAELRNRVDGEVRFDAGTRAAYSTDASNFRQVPLGVVLPRTVDAAVEAVAVCHRARSAGRVPRWRDEPGRAVHQRGRGHRLLEVLPPAGLGRRDARTCVVEPGIVLDDAQPAARAHRACGSGPSRRPTPTARWAG